MSAYRRAEREVIRGFALQTLTDAASTDDDRASAARRLLGDDGREPDFGLLSTDELRAFHEAGHTLRRLFAKARGDAPTKRDEQLSVEYTPQPPAPVADLAADDEQRIRATMAAAIAKHMPAPAVEPEPPAPQPYTLAQILGR